MLKQLKFAAIALLVAVGFTACSEDDPAPNLAPLRGEAGMYVINQGNSFGNVAGALDFIAQNGTKTDSVFFKANGQLIGDNPQKPIIYGSKMYVPVYKSGLVWVLDANTATVIASVQTNQPQAVCASNGHVYISNFDGFVTRIDSNLVSGDFTVQDFKLYDFMRLLHKTEDVLIEPSSCAAFIGPVHLESSQAGQDYLAKQGLTADVLKNATHICWATGGRLVPDEVWDEYLKKTIE